MARLPLDQLRVIDLGSWIAGPAAATMMSDFGADVIKVEPPEGDPYRNVLAAQPVNYFWLLDARNKRSLAIDLKQDAGLAVLLRLIDVSDVFVTNYRTNLLQRLMLDYATLAKRNPGLIYAQITGYGETGPEADKTGFDVTTWWARSGLQDFMRAPGQKPISSAPGMGDHPTASTLFGAIMMALYQRERTGKGSKVGTSLIANGAWSNSMILQGMVAGTDWVANRQADAPIVNALNSLYATQDGRWVHLALHNAGKEWPKLVRALNRIELLTDQRFVNAEARAANAVELQRIIAETFAARTLDEIKPSLQREAVTFGFAASPTEVINDPQLRATGVITPVASPAEGYAVTISSPIWMDGVTKRTPRTAPALGQHSAKILAEIGVTAEEIEKLLAAKVLLMPNA